MVKLFKLYKSIDEYYFPIEYEKDGDDYICTCIAIGISLKFIHMGKYLFEEESTLDEVDGNKEEVNKLLFNGVFNYDYLDR